MCCKKPERAARHFRQASKPLPPSLPAYAMPHAGKVAVSFTQAGMGTGAREEEDWRSGKARRTSEEFVQSDDGVGPLPRPTDHAADETVDAASRLPAQTNQKFRIDKGNSRSRLEVIWLRINNHPFICRKYAGKQKVPSLFCFQSLNSKGKIGPHLSLQRFKTTC